MTPEQIDAVELTLAVIRPDVDRVAADFYRRLFAAEPSIAALFSSDLARQRAKFTAELATIVGSIRRHDAFRMAGGALGARHHGYGVRAVHYRHVRDALLASLQDALGAEWTPTVEEAWRRAYNLVAETMMDGAATG